MTSSPTWCLENSGSFSSIHVILPPGTQVHCETDAVVTFSGGIEVEGMMAGGFWGSLFRVFLGGESFFTTVVKNTHALLPGDVMMAPSDPGGIELHRLAAGQGDLLLTSGAYVASDVSVNITTAMQSQISNSLLSGTGFFLLRASGRGIVACAAYGSIHKYELKAGETRSVDNGHLVAWSANMQYRTGLASRQGIMASMKTGEGLMCHFTGPGTIYLQSHKPGEADTVIKHGKGKAKTAAQAGVVAYLVVIPMLLFFVVAMVVLGLHLSNMNVVQGEFSRSYDNSNNNEYSYGASSRSRPSQRGYRAVGDL